MSTGHSLHDGSGKSGPPHAPGSHHSSAGEELFARPPDYHSRLSCAMGGMYSDAPIGLVCYKCCPLREDCIKTVHLWQTSNCRGMGNLSVFMVGAEMTAVKDSQEWCQKLGDLNIFPHGELLLCVLCFVGAHPYSIFIVGVGSNLFEAGTTFSVEVMYHLERGAGF